MLAEWGKRVSGTIPARELLDAVAFIGAAPDWEEVCGRALAALSRLVPADQHFCCIADVTLPQGIERVSLISAELDQDVRRSYLDYYYSRDPARKTTDPSTSTFQVNWNKGIFSRNEFAVDFMRGLMHAELSAGIPLLATDGSGGVMFGFTRSRAKPLSQREEAVLHGLRPHLANYYAIHKKLDSLPGKSYYAAELARGNGLLSRREAEVAALLCRRLRAAEIAAILHISPRTVERHVEHIYLKLNVRTRRELLLKLLPGRL
jgi:DNA-binding CsgD family transcriptional regulator